MQLKDIVKNSAYLLNREHVVKYIEGEDADNGDAKEQTDIFVFCANLVVNELASSFCSMKKIEKMDVEKGRLKYTAFSETPMEIIKVENDNGEEIPYANDGDALKIKAGRCVVTYKYLPPTYGLKDEVKFEDKRVTARTLAYGVVAEVCLIERAFDESVSYRKRYSEEISKLILPKTKSVKARRWS